MFDLVKLLNIIKDNSSTELDLSHEKTIDFSAAQQSSFSFPDERQQGVHLQLVQLSETHLLTTHSKFARVWNLDSNETVIIKSPSSKHGIINVKRLANNRILFNQPDSADIYIYDWKEQKLICKISPGGACAVLENSNLVMVKGDKTGKIAIEIWDSERGTLLNTFYEKLAKLKYPISIYPVFSLGDDKIAFIIKEINTLFVWDVKNGQQINSINNIYTAPSPVGLVCPITKLSSGKHVVTSCKQDALDIWDIESGSHIQTFKTLAGLSTYLVCNNGQLVTVYKTGDMQVWDLQTGKDIQLLKNAGGVLFQISDNLIVTVPRDGNVKIWDTQNWQCLKVLGGYYTTPPISCVEISDNKLAVLYYDQLRIWKFGYRHLQLQDIIELLKALKDNHSITILNLANVILNDQGAIEIANLLTKRITTIDLRNTNITDKGAEVLWDVFQHNYCTGLKALKLDGNSISADLLEKISNYFVLREQRLKKIAEVRQKQKMEKVQEERPKQYSSKRAPFPKEERPFQEHRARQEAQLKQFQSTENTLSKEESSEQPSGATVKDSSAKEKIKAFNIGNSPAIAHVDSTEAQNITAVSLKQTIPARSSNSNSASSTSIPQPLSSPPAPSASVSHTRVGSNLNVTSKVKNIQPVATVSNAQVTGNVTVSSNIHYEQKSFPSPEEKRIASQQKLEDDLRRLRDHQLKNEETQQELAVYVPIQGSNNFEDNELFDVATKVKVFLASKKKVLLLLGDSGMGKSLFGRALERELWESYDSSKPIPLFISLPSLRDPIKNTIEEYLSQLGFKQQQIDQLKKEHSFIFILDGYDEIASHNPDNLYVSNKLSHWNAKVIISCRSQYLLAKKQVYRNRFLPDYKDQPEPGLFQEIMLKPFTQKQIEIYLKKFIEVEKPLWGDWQIYRKHIDAISGLKTLIETPFILRITVEVLPDLIEEDQKENYTELTRLKLYDAFVQRWFERQEYKLRKQGHPIEEDWDIKNDFRNFSEKLAKKMLEQKINEIVIETKVKQRFGQSQAQSSAGQWDEFFSNDPTLQLIRSGCPLKKLGDNRFAFIHESLLEYFGDRGKFSQSMTPKISAKRIFRSPPPLELFSESIVEKELTESLPLEQTQSSLEQEPDKQQQGFGFWKSLFKQEPDKKQQQPFSFWQSSDTQIRTEQLQPGEEFYQNGMMYFMRSQYLKALPCFEAAAEQSYPAAYLRLGWLYLEGGRVGPRDIKSQQWYQKAAQSFEWFKAQAETKNAAALYDLGCCYYYGKGVNQDYAEAVRWFQKAADQGYALAQYDLGYCYYHGQGVNQSHVEGVKWYRKAAEQGYAPAQRHLGFSYEHGNGINQDYAEALKWYQKAVDQGYSEAQHNLGVCYEYGRGVREDLAEAVRWFREAANQGHAVAQYMMGFSYQNGRGVKKDYTEAAIWYQKAADQELKEAKDKLEQYPYLKNLLFNPGSSLLRPR